MLCPGAIRKGAAPEGGSFTDGVVLGFT